MANCFDNIFYIYIIVEWQIVQVYVQMDSKEDEMTFYHSQVFPDSIHITLFLILAIFSSVCMYKYRYTTGFESDGMTTITVVRRLVTNDTEFDNPISRDGDTNIIFSFGSSDVLAYHGQNRGAGIINFAT